MSLIYLFHWNNYQARGGIHDLHGSFADLATLEQALMDGRRRYLDVAQAVRFDEQGHPVVVADYWCSDHWHDVENVWQFAPGTARWVRMGNPEAPMRELVVERLAAEVYV